MASCQVADPSKPYDASCALPPSEEDFRAGNNVYINVLADTLPDCNRKEGTTSLPELGSADKCYVYCAQESCTAADAFMTANADLLHSKCATTIYLREGALAMEPSELVGGASCHGAIRAYNAAAEDLAPQTGCLTCQAGGGEAKLVPVALGDASADAPLLSTSGTIPDWFLEKHVYSPLPPQFTCDDRYKTTPEPHSPEGDDVVVFEMRDVSQAGLPSDATLSYWASEPHESGGDLPAPEAYGDFANSGITKCEAGVCRMPMRRPSPYTVGGERFAAHVHFTHWDDADGRWALPARTVMFPDGL